MADPALPPHVSTKPELMYNNEEMSRSLMVQNQEDARNNKT